MKKRSRRSSKRALNKQKLWDEALEMWQQVLERDHTHDQATKAVNRIRTQKNKKDLEEARKLFKDKKYSESAKLLRKIKDASPTSTTPRANLRGSKRPREPAHPSARQARQAGQCPSLLEAQTLLEQCKSIDTKDEEVFEALRQTSRG